jgi:hypothetical protein
MVEILDDKGEAVLDEHGNPKMRRKYIHHGTYQASEDNLVDNSPRKVINGKGEEKIFRGGLSVLTPETLFGYLIRN